jgi:hypothetical protein
MSKEDFQQTQNVTDNIEQSSYKAVENASTPICLDMPRDSMAFVRQRVANIKSHYDWIMRTDPNGGTYEQRKAKLQEKIKEQFKEFIFERDKEYRRARCYYSVAVKCKGSGPGSGLSTCDVSIIVGDPSFFLFRHTVQRLGNGHKNEISFNDESTVATCKIGATGSNENTGGLTGVAGYRENSITSFVGIEVGQLRKMLHEEKLPNDLD